MCSKTGCNLDGLWLGRDENNELKLMLNFGTSIPHEELNEDWLVKQINSTLLKLENTNSSNGRIDYLMFEKTS